MSHAIGQSVRRMEDAPLLTGRGRFTDDINLAGQAYMAVVRSPHAHARIVAIETAAAAALPGVLAVYTVAELIADGVAGIPSQVRSPGFEFRNRDGSAMPDPPYPLLAEDVVRYVGEPVAAVIAESRSAALDGAEAVAVDYHPLAAVCEVGAALAPGAPELRDDAPGNRIFDWQIGDAEAVDAAFAGAAWTACIEVVNNRLVINYLEPRAAIGDYDTAGGRYTLHAGSQGVHGQQATLAEVLGVETDRIRVLSGDVGGGFGGKGFLYPEYVLVVWAARRLGRPVKWTGTRSEHFLADIQARDHLDGAALALDSHGRFLALRVTSMINIGAYIVPHAVFVPIFHFSRILSSVYAIRHIHARLEGAFTNTAPLHAYRGIGRAEAIYLIERLIERAARVTGIDAVTLRRRNFIAPEAMPYTTPVGVTYDSGAFAETMDKALALAGWDDVGRRREEARERGRLRGIGMACYIEDAGGPPTEFVQARVNADGTVDGYAGSQSNGQGHATSFAQVLSQRLGVPFASVRITWGDTDTVRAGVGSYASRSMQMVGSGLVEASAKIIELGRRVAGHLLAAPPEDIAYDGGVFSRKNSNASIGLFEVAAAMARGSEAGGALPDELRGELAAALTYQAKGDSFPNGCHVAEVEIDPQTGAVELVNYTAVDDFGCLVNPLLVEGQVHGAIAQGLGQAMLEHTVYDADSGQLLTGSFMDYALPRADNMPHRLITAYNPTPCLNNPLGVKGAGEGGAIGAPPAIMNAAIDALAERGVADLDMPLTPLRVWRAIQDAQAHTKARP